MEKIKVSREVADFIKGYEDNVASYNGWENHLIMEHCRAYYTRYEGCKEQALAMKDIEPIQLAEMLVNGYEVEEKYNKDDLSKMFKFKVSEDDIEYTAIIFKDNVYIAYEYNGEFISSVSALSVVLNFLNKGLWVIVE